MPRASGKGRHVLGAAVAVWVASAAVGVGTAAADTFTYTGGEQSYTVSAGITGLHVVLVGAAGASETVPDLSAAGGHGARLTADVPVPAGTATLYVEVGGTGTSANPPSLAYTATGGFNGGGNGPFGGGGASDIRTVSSGQPNSLSSRLAVAGSGGGAGANVDYSANGGDAGNADGSGNPGVGIISGSGATTIIAGQATDQATVMSYCQNTGAVDGQPADAGASGAGGNGAFVLISGTPISGGGAGGINGGGGGAHCYSSPGAAATEHAGAGGAGSSGAPSGQNVQITIDTSDPAEVIITAPVPANTAPPTLTGGLTVGDGGETFLALGVAASGRRAGPRGCCPISGLRVLTSDDAVGERTAARDRIGGGPCGRLAAVGEAVAPAGDCGVAAGRVRGRRLEQGRSAGEPAGPAVPAVRVGRGWGDPVRGGAAAVVS